MRQTLEVLGLASICLLAGLVLSGFQGTPAPLKLTPPVLGQGVLLNWLTTNPDGTTYNVYMNVGACPITPIPGPPIQTGLTQPAALFSAIAPGAYCFAVTAVIAGVECGQSNQASVVIPVGKFDDLGIGTGLVRFGGGLTPATIATSFYLEAGATPPTTCQMTNQVFFQTQLNPSGSLENFKILVCDLTTRTFKNLPLVKQGG